jgi:hypothetical protein
MSEADKDKFQLYVMNSGKWPRWLLPGSTQAELVARAKRLLAEATTFDDQAHGFCGQVAAKAAGSGMLGTGGLSLEDLQPEKAAEVLAAKRRMVQEVESDRSGRESAADQALIRWGGWLTYFAHEGSLSYVSIPCFSSVRRDCALCRGFFCGAR